MTAPTQRKRQPKQAPRRDPAENPLLVGLAAFAAGTTAYLLLGACDPSVTDRPTQPSTIDTCVARLTQDLSC